MVDDLKIEIAIEPPFEFKEKVTYPFEINGIVFSPEFNKSGDVISYSGKKENLYVKMISGKLLVMNSWHKFQQGNNYSDFTWKNLQDCLQNLAKIFGEGFWKARITKLTTSVNLHYDATGVIDDLISYKGSPMEPMRPRNSSKAYGKRFATTHYNIKVYDKSFQVNKEDRISILPTLRIEKEMKLPYFQKRRKNPVKIYTPSDLLNSVSFDYLAFELFEAIWSLGFKYGIDPMKVHDFHDATVVVFMGDPDYRKVLKKKSNYRTYKGHERRYEELRNEFRIQDCNEILNSLLEEKIIQLRPVEVAQKAV
ncbi:hypothetical protein [Algoriphagus aquimarinus]|uniref:hypothetical protein n=1 Tax=Algoriphagus aquimarinus TaxID=237018 RepID=UPI0030D9FE68|tara:strand:+ start:849 stop:1775 length:927 start_codon:yes stop_codon:yes gene_type:complete